MLELLPETEELYEIKSLSGKRLFIGYSQGLTYKCYYNNCTVNIFDGAMEVNMFTADEPIKTLEQFEYWVNYE